MRNCSVTGTQNSRTDSLDDIIHVASFINGRGFFTNVEGTRRQGVEAGAQYKSQTWLAYANYSFIDATYRFTGDIPWERMTVPPATAGSWEDVLHRAGAVDKMFLFQGDEPDALRTRRGHRAIGVVYHPEYERYGNYVPTVLPRRYDAFLFLDETRALRPLHMPVREAEELPETYPTGV